MTIGVACPECDKVYELDTVYIGKTVTCECGAAFIVPSPPPPSPPPVRSEFVFTCPACRNQLDVAAELDGKQTSCPICGAQIFPTAKPLVRAHDPKSAVRLSPKNRSTFLLLGLFLGGWGVHEFYLGNVWFGAFFLFCTLVFASFVAIEPVGAIIFYLFMLSVLIYDLMTTSTDSTGAKLR